MNFIHELHIFVYVTLFAYVLYELSCEIMGVFLSAHIDESQQAL